MTLRSGKKFDMAESKTSIYTRVLRPSTRYARSPHAPRVPVSHGKRASQVAVTRVPTAKRRVTRKLTKSAPQQTCSYISEHCRSLTAHYIGSLSIFALDIGNYISPVTVCCSHLRCREHSVAHMMFLRRKGKINNKKKCSINTFSFCQIYLPMNISKSSNKEIFI